MDSSRQLGVMGVLKEALIIPTRNKKLMIPTMLLAFLPCSFLLMGNYISIYPRLLKFIDKLYLLSQTDPVTPQFYSMLVGLKNSAEDLINVDTAFRISSYIVSVFSMMLVIHGSATVYSGKLVTVKDLLLIVGQQWKGPFITCVYFTLLDTGYAVLLVSLISLSILNANGSAGLIMIGAFFVLVACMLYVYLAMAWTVGLVISVLDEGCYGLEALGKAGEFVKGRRTQGFFIAFILLCLNAVVGIIYGFGVTYVQGQVFMIQKIGVLAMVNMSLLLKMYSHMVDTVFYYECGKSKGKVGEELGFMGYARVHDALHYNEERLEKN